MAEEKEPKQGLMIRGRIKKKEFQEGKEGKETRYFLLVDALGMDGVLKIQLPLAVWTALEIGTTYQSFLDFTVRREGWLTFIPV